jgi:hypothetical protein
VQGDAFAFEAGGMEPGGAGVANDEDPLAIDARAIAGKPLPGKPRASGGRCCHSTIPEKCNRRGFSQEASRTLGTGESPN